MNEPVEERSQLVTVGLAWGSVAASVIALAVAMRIAGAISLPLGWLAMWGPAAVLVGLSAASVRLVWPPSRTLITLVATVIVALGPLAWFAELLKRVTHHRPLGAATFSVIGLLLLLLTLAFVSRLVVLGFAKRRLVPRLVLYGSMVVGGGLGLVLLVSALGGAHSLALRSGLLDAILLLVGVAAAAWAPKWKWADHPGVAVGVWLVPLLISAGVLTFIPTTRVIVARNAPALLPLAGWLGG